MYLSSATWAMGRPLPFGALGLLRSAFDFREAHCDPTCRPSPRPIGKPAAFLDAVPKGVVRSLAVELEI